MSSAILLWPLSKVYGAVTRARNLLYDFGAISCQRAALPVVSVGNLSAGGNGKTPLCILLSRELKQRGYQPVLLMRGYGGGFSGPLVVEEQHSPSQVGDEAVLLRRCTGCPIVVSRARVAGCKLIEERNLGNIIILDDGFQHRRLARDVDILTAHVGTEEALNEFLAGGILPFGEFREDPAKALKRAHMLVFFSGADAAGKQREVDPRLLLRVPQNIQVYRAHVEPREVKALAGGAPLAPQAVVAFCAIAHPDRFFATLISMGYPLAGVEIFPDHHIFSQEELDALRQKYPAQQFVCTEKDAVKLQNLHHDRMHVLGIDAVVRPLDAFVTQVLRMVVQRREPAGQRWNSYQANA